MFIIDRVLGMLLIEACGEALRHDADRTVWCSSVCADQPNGFFDDRLVARLIQSLLDLSPYEVEQELAEAMAAYGDRHHDLELLLRRRYHELVKRFPVLEGIGEAQARLVALFSSREVAVETSALFSPSAVAHFDQRDVGEGDLRFILSLRGVGERQVSSLIFQTGTWRRDGSVELDARSKRAVAPRSERSAISGPQSVSLAFAETPLRERVIHPFWSFQGGGLGNARFCRFVDDDGSVDYRCTFTSFDDAVMRQDVLLTGDFRSVDAQRLDGPLAHGGGAAWFPRRIGGLFHMLGSVADGALAVYRSDSAYTWGTGDTVLSPERPWELGGLHVGGSPVEIAEGWLVLTHGVGRAGRCCIGAALLDREDPARLLARSARPLLEPPDHDGRGGYVPGSVATCGALLRGRTLLLPYGVADTFTAFANVDVDDLIATMDWFL